MTPKATRKCDLCKKEKDVKSEFYPGARHRVCIACNSDFASIKAFRRMLREGGTVALEDRIREYMHKANMARAVLRNARRGTNQTNQEEGTN